MAAPTSSSSDPPNGSLDPDEGPPSPADCNIEPSELPHLRRTHLTAGYRAGISAGKSDPTTAQNGFDTGYPTGAAMGMRVGFLLGSLRRLEDEEIVKRAERELDLSQLMAEGGLALDGHDMEKEKRFPQLEVLKKWEGFLEDLGGKTGVDLRYLKQ